MHINRRRAQTAGWGARNSTDRSKRRGSLNLHREAHLSRCSLDCTKGSAQPAQEHFDAEIIQKDAR
jgi:hypothetical protein